MPNGFNTQPPEGGWGGFVRQRQMGVVSTHSRLKAAGDHRAHGRCPIAVSTHSRLKAAGHFDSPKEKAACFNTQPPEGGWAGHIGRLHLRAVSTHSRLKAAGLSCTVKNSPFFCFNTQPPEGGWYRLLRRQIRTVRFNTQPPEGGWARHQRQPAIPHRFNTQPPEGGWPPCLPAVGYQTGFNTQPPEGGWEYISGEVERVGRVSTHSRLKAAGAAYPLSLLHSLCFNTQPPEGGWSDGIHTLSF